jgi:uncharacterized protein (DUF169 family)
MDMSFSELAQGIGAGLGLSRQPIALVFVDEPPQGINQTVEEVPSSCAFWRQAEERIFYAPAERHFNCPVGAMVMGFELPTAIQAELLTVARMMGDCDYLTADEVPRIPSMKKAKKGIVYGPLKDFPIAPDIILLWLTPTQSMIFSEAAGSSKWSEIVSPAPSGRPACAVVPLALERGQPTLSLGCMGMRTFTQITDGLLLAALPGHQAAEFLNRLETTVAANSAMQKFYQDRRAALA